MTEDTKLNDTYCRLWDGMVTKDAGVLSDILDEEFVLIHMTGMRQDKEAFITAVLDGTLNYFSAQHERIVTGSQAGEAHLSEKTKAAAAVFGGSRQNWNLLMRINLKKVDEGFKITKARVDTY